MPENLINLIMYAIACQANRWNTYAYACCINNVATSGQPDKMHGFAAIEENIQLTFYLNDGVVVICGLASYSMYLKRLAIARYILCFLIVLVAEYWNCIEKCADVIH